MDHVAMCVTAEWMHHTSMMDDIPRVEPSSSISPLLWFISRPPFLAVAGMVSSIDQRLSS